MLDLGFWWQWLQTVLSSGRQDWAVWYKWTHSAYSSTLKMETVGSSKIAANFYHTTRFYIPEHSNLHNLNVIIKICNMILLFNPCFGFHIMYYSKLSKYYTWTTDTNIKFNENPMKHETFYAYGVKKSSFIWTLKQINTKHASHLNHNFCKLKWL